MSRPPQSLGDATDNQRGLMEALSKTKFALAFSNRVRLGTQTHPKREYVTGRWTDSYASGYHSCWRSPRSEFGRVTSVARRHARYRDGRSK
jgi:hypothetical protein